MQKSVLDFYRKNHSFQMMTNCAIFILSLYTFAFTAPLYHPLAFISLVTLVFSAVNIVKQLTVTFNSSNDSYFLIIENKDEMYELWVKVSNNFYKCLLKDCSEERVKRRMEAYVRAEKRACEIDGRSECKQVTAYTHEGKFLRKIIKRKDDTSETEKTKFHLGSVRKKAV